MTGALALVARMVRDAEDTQRQFAPLALDAPAAFRGVIGSLEEQIEKIDKAASAEEESRYAQATLFDMRDNLEGARTTWTVFRPWVVSRGVDLATRVDARFTALAGHDATLSGDALPAVPEGWNPDAPSTEHQATPYRRLRAAVSAETDPGREVSLVREMSRAADLMDIPRLP